MFDVLRGTPFHEDATRVLAKFEQTMNASERKEHGALGQHFAYVPDGGTKACVAVCKRDTPREPGGSGFSAPAAAPASV